MMYHLLGVFIMALPVLLILAAVRAATQKTPYKWWQYFTTAILGSTLIVLFEIGRLLAISH